MLGLSFKDSLTWLCGDAPAQIDPAEMERRRKRAAEVQRQQDDYAEKARRKARRDAKNIWNRATRDPAALAGIADYLERRGITRAMLPVPPFALRWLPDHACVKKIGGELVTAHRGPAMVALIQSPDGRGSAVHQTWVDLGQAGGKAVIAHRGEALPSKMVRGSKKGNAIRLSTPKGATVLVMGHARPSEGMTGFPLAIHLGAHFLHNQSGGTLRAVSTYVRRGRSVSVVRTLVHGEDERLIADVSTSHVLAQ